MHADTLSEARGYRAEAVRQGAREVPTPEVHRIVHARVRSGDVLYDAGGREVDEVLYFT